MLGFLPRKRASHQEFTIYSSDENCPEMLLDSGQKLAAGKTLRDTHQKTDRNEFLSVYIIICPDL